MKTRNGFVKRILSVMLAFAMISTITVFEAPNNVSAAATDAIYYVYSSNSPTAYLNEYEEHKTNTAQYIMCTDNGVLPSTLKTKISNGNATFIFAPGAYLIESITLTVGNNTVFTGAVPIIQPVNIKQIMYPDATTMAVFETRSIHPSSYEASYEIGTITTRSLATGITISNIAMSGYTMIKLNSTKSSVIKNVLLHNYRGTYTGLFRDNYPEDGYTPLGAWCNMGYSGATGTLYISGACSDLTIQNVQIQFSSHHGVAFQSGDRGIWTKNVTISKTRALYCGNGQLRGENDNERQSCINSLPETNGRGYVDWSVAFDLCENQSIENVVVSDCYALEGWKCGFYTEPESTGGYVKNLQFIRCRSDNAGQRTVLPNSSPKTTIVRETENSNFFTQGGYFEDCISVNAEKCGYLVMADRAEANANGTSRLKMVRCIDMGSPISLVSEMNDSQYIDCDGFVSLLPTKAAFWLFGTNSMKFTNTKVLASSVNTSTPFRLGFMLRQQFIESRSLGNVNQTIYNYAKLRAHITNSLLSATVYGLPAGTSAYQVESAVNSKDGEPATFRADGSTSVSLPTTGVTINRATGTLNVASYVNDNWGREKYTVKFYSNGGTSVASKTAYAENKITAPTSPKKTAYTFLGWYTKLSGGTRISFPYTVTKNVTLYAHWKVAKPSAPKYVSASRIASRTIKVKWQAVTKVAGYSIYRATSAYGTYKRITNTKYLSYTNKYLTAGKYYYYKVKAYRMSGSTKIYSNYSKYVRARA